jgi:plasmid stabilization system protein ParE
MRHAVKAGTRTPAAGSNLRFRLRFFYRAFNPARSQDLENAMNRKLRLHAAAPELGIPVSTLRALRFKAQPRIAASGQTLAGNGFASAFVTLGRAVYVDIDKFHRIWAEQQSTGAVHVQR